MDLKKYFIKATEEFNTFEHYVAAPCIRRSFTSREAASAVLQIACCGFYELYFNGKRITKGFIAPYISNGDHYIYYDEYTVEIEPGENVIGLMLGNGFLNNPGGYIWDFEKNPFRSAPMAALSLCWKDADGRDITLVSDESFLTAPSSIRSDDYRFGEICDANYEQPGWNEPGFDPAGWKSVIRTNPPRGSLRLCDADPITTEKELKPVDIFPDGEGGYIYDFGESNSGVCRMTVQGEKGQKITLQHGDLVENNKLVVSNVWFVREFWDYDKNIVHKDTYICRGEGTETYMPTFTYHAFRYVRVCGITEEQAVPELLTYVVFHSHLETRGNFSCSDPMANKLQEITRRSDLSNFHYFPTDCPHREKNGWTADAALSSEHLLLNFNPERSYREWMRNICKAQLDYGGLPGIVPTYGWGNEWGNGPAWDSVLAYLPYYVYVYRGTTDMIRESAHSFISYLHYLTVRADERGLVHFGLGDWCPAGREEPQAPLEVTDSVMAVDIAAKMAVMFEAVGMLPQRDFAKAVSDGFQTAIRNHLIDFNTMLVKGSCQTCQAMCIYYGIFTEEEAEKAAEQLVRIIHEADDHMDFGVLGARVVFHVLSKYGYSDLAYKMITRTDFPSYGNWVKRGATTLWENFAPDSVNSTNHHFWGDISSWFIQNLAGIQLNPSRTNIHEVRIKPSFVEALTHAEAYHIAPDGKISSGWKREGNSILLTVEIPEQMTAIALLPDGFRFENPPADGKLTTGSYRILSV